MLIHLDYVGGVEWYRWISGDFESSNKPFVRITVTSILLVLLI